MRLISAGSLVRAQSGPLLKVREGEGAFVSARGARAPQSTSRTKLESVKIKCRMSIFPIDHPAFRAFFRKSEAAFVREKAPRSSFPYCPPTGTAKYAVNTPVVGSIALPV